MKKIFYSLFFFVLLVFTISTVSAYSIIVHPLDDDGNEVPKTVFDYRFEFSNDSVCSNVIFSHDETIETSESGIAVIQIDTSTVSQIPKYICEYKNLVLRTIHNVSDQFFNKVYVGAINTSANITASYFFGDGSQLTGLAGGGDINEVTTLGEYLIGGADSGVVSLLINETKLNETILKISSNTEGNLSISGNISADLGYFNRVTVVGSTILQGLTLSQDIIPITTRLYTIGNSTHWFKELWAENIYGEFINSTIINTTNLNADNIKTDSVDSSRVNTTNLTLGEYELYTDISGGLNINLG